MNSTPFPTQEEIPDDELFEDMKESAQLLFEMHGAVSGQMNICAHRLKESSHADFTDLLIAAQRVVIGSNPKHPKWYGGMMSNGIKELEAILKRRPEWEVNEK